MNRYLFQITLLGGFTKDVEVKADNLAAAWFQIAYDKGSHAQSIILLEGDNL